MQVLDHSAREMKRANGGRQKNALDNEQYGTQQIKTTFPNQQLGYLMYRTKQLDGRSPQLGSTLVSRRWPDITVHGSDRQKYGLGSCLILERFPSSMMQPSQTQLSFPPPWLHRAHRSGQPTQRSPPRREEVNAVAVDRIDTGSRRFPVHRSVQLSATRSTVPWWKWRCRKGSTASSWAKIACHSQGSSAVEMSNSWQGWDWKVRTGDQLETCSV